MATIDDDGFTPDTQGEREDALDASMLAAFPAEGTDFLDLTEDSFTGRQNAVLAEQLVSSDNLAAQFIDLLDPTQATGVWVDFHLRTQGTRRKAATNSQIAALAVGAPGTPIGDKLVRFLPNDSLWRTPQLDLEGNPLAIAANGSLTLILTATQTGLVNAVETGTTSWLIVDQVVGWDNTVGSIESTARASLGTAVESDFEGRTRLSNPATSALGGAATKPAIVKAFNAINGVTDADINNNRSLVPDGDGVPGKSIEAVVEGGDPQEIANTALAVYQGTAGYFGNTTLTASVSFERLDGETVVVTEEASWTVPELVQIEAQYTITYGRPDLAPDDGGVAIALETASAYINGAGRGVDVVPTASAAAVTAALPPESEPVTIGIVAVKGFALGAADIPISVRQRAFTNPEPQGAVVTGTVSEPFNMTLTWVLVLSIDGGAQVSVTFSATDFAIISAARAAEVANAIAAQVTTLDAGVNEGALQLVSKSSGSASRIDILGATSPDLLAELGLSVGSSPGSDGDIIVVVTP